MAYNYRPYVTAEEIEELCSILAPLSTNSGVLTRLYKKFYTLHLKVQSNIITPGYTSNPGVSLEEKIGLVPATPTPIADPVALRIAAYNKKQRGEVLTPDEVELAETYEWEQESKL